MSKDTKTMTETGQETGSNPAPAKAPETSVAKSAGGQPVALSSQAIAAKAVDPAATRPYIVATEGRATGSYQKVGAEIQLNEKQARFLLLGGHITDPSKPVAAKADAGKAV